MSASRISPAPSRAPPDSLGTAVFTHALSLCEDAPAFRGHAALHGRGVPYRAQIRPNPTTIWQARLVSEPHPHHLTPPFHTPSLQPWPPQSYQSYQSYPPASLHAQAQTLHCFTGGALLASQLPASLQVMCIFESTGVELPRTYCYPAPPWHGWWSKEAQRLVHCPASS